MLQLIVAIRQQPSVSDEYATLQPMVAKVSLAEKRAFSAALHDLLDSIPAASKDRKRVSWVAVICKVKYQSAYKYLNGQSIPSREKIRRLISEIGPKASVLLGGKIPRDSDVEPSGSIGNDLFGRKLSALWGQLSDEVKGQIYGFAAVQAVVLPKDPDPIRKKQKGSGNGEPS